MSTVKVLRKLAMEDQSSTTYEDSAMFLMPFTSGIPNTKFDPIEDAAIVGHGFKDIPQQGIQHVFEDSIEFQFDKISSAVLLQATMGAPAATVYSFANHVKKLSVCALTDVNAIDYGSVYVKSLGIKGAVNANWTLNAAFVAMLAESRGVVGNFPATTDPDEPFVFHEASGTGYIRVGDSADALASGDNITVEDFNLELVTGFDGQWTNNGRLSLIPLFGQTAPSVSGSFTVARHDTDQWLDWEDANTALQAEIYIYKSATASVKIQIPRFIISAELSDDDVTKINVDMKIGRNGTGTSYKNTNMAFTAPIAITLVNS